VDEAEELFSTEESPKDAKRANTSLKNNSNMIRSIDQSKPGCSKQPSSQSTIELLLDLDFESVSIPSTSGLICSRFSRAPAQFVPEEYFMALTSVQSGGITIEAQFSRSPSLFSNKMVCVELIVWFKNPHSQLDQTNVQIVPANDPHVTTSGPVKLFGLHESERRHATLGIDFGDGGRVSEWTVHWADGKRANFQLQAPFGEQLEVIELSADEFERQHAQLSGMNQIKRKLSSDPPEHFNPKEIYRICNCKQVLDLKWSFSAQTISRKNIVLISLVELDYTWDVLVNCENVTFGSILCKEIQKSLELVKSE